jgi:4-hydroxy-tetrahydrodipicolinate synthase
VKDATANMARVCAHGDGEDFNQLSARTSHCAWLNAHGGHGCISVTANEAPRLCSEFQAACLKGDYTTALRLQDKLSPLHINPFAETSLAPIKYARCRCSAGATTPCGCRWCRRAEKAQNGRPSPWFMRA